MTLTSVGYGDVLPFGWRSQIFSIFVMLMGSAVFGAVVSVCSYKLHKSLNNEVGKMIGDLTHFMQRRGVPLDLQWRVQDNIRRHAILSETTAMAPHLLASLSPAIRKELCMSILEETLTRFPLFKMAQRAFVVELAQAHSWEHVLHG